MENLTKQQIVLVTLLVSFVTSIATGIVTVALMDQAPPGVTQTINRVVERTIEKVVQVPTQSTQAVTKETVVVKADDMVVAAIDKNSSRIVRIAAVPVEGGTPRPIAIGLIASSDGLVISDKFVISPDIKYEAVFPSGKTYGLEGVLDSEGQLSLMKMSSMGTDTPAFLPAALGDSNKLQLGQTVVMLGGKERNIVETGMISSLVKSEPANASSTPAVSVIETNLSEKESVSGDILMNLSGEVIGIKIYKNDSWIYLPVSAIQNTLNIYNSREKAKMSANTSGTAQAQSSANPAQ